MNPSCAFSDPLLDACVANGQYVYNVSSTFHSLEEPFYAEDGSWTVAGTWATDDVRIAGKLAQPVRAETHCSHMLEW